MDDTRRFRPFLLCIAPPPVTPTAPPAAAAYLLGYLKQRGCHDFDFLDLRLGMPDAHSPTWTYTGAFAESFVMDIPDLPLVLGLLRGVEGGQSPVPERNALFERYCLERSISSDYLYAYLEGLHRYLEHALNQVPEVRFIGFTVWNTNYLATLMAAALLKRRKRPPFIIAGGPQVTASRASAALGLRSRLFDLVALGEGEETLWQVYREFAREGRVRAGLPGSLSLGPNGSLVEVERPLLRINELPMPSFAEMDIGAYQREQGITALPLQLSRGCTDKCAFCSEWTFWRRYRPDDVDRIVEQVKTLEREYRANFFVFMDSLLNGVPRRLVSFARALIRADCDVWWASFMRANMDAPTARLLARSGCHDVFVGIESFSDETLELMRKRRTKTDNIRSLEAFLEAGIDVTAGFIPGFPGDTREAFLASARILREIQDAHPGALEVQIEPFSLQPGSPIHEDPASAGLTPITWAEEYLDIAPDYADITSRIWCRVEGAGQGLERLGRVAIVESLDTTVHANSGFTFIRSHEEHLSHNVFDSEHLGGGWSLVRRRSEEGHVYGLIVNDREWEQLDDLQLTGSLEHGSQRALSSLLNRLERQHLIAPNRRRMRAVPVRRPANGTNGTRYVVSPYVIARSVTASGRRSILAVHVANERYSRLNERYGSLLAAMRSRPISEAALQRRALRQLPETDERWVQRALRRLVADGITVTTSSPKAGQLTSR